MQPLNAGEIRGTWASLLLPISDGDVIDFERLKVQIDTLMGTGIDGIYCNGTSGEFETLTEAEFERIAALLAERCEHRGLPFQIGACAGSPREALRRIGRAAEFKPGAIQVILPDGWPTTDAEATDALRRYAEAAAGIGRVLYNPPHAKRVLSPRAIGTLAAAVPELAGLKVGGGDAKWYADVRLCAGRLSLFVPGHVLATGMTRGASGTYSNVACLSPGFAMAWQSIMKSDMEQAGVIEGRILNEKGSLGRL